MRYWTESELDFMRRNYTKMPKKEIAERLGRSITSIKSKARTSKGNFCDENYKKGHQEKCENCGEIFHRPLSKVKRNAHNFCSEECFYSSKWYKNHILQKAFRNAYKRPTSFEQKIIDLCRKYNLPFKYVGNGKIWIEGKNPDFINTNGKKQIIETYFTKWHTHLGNYEEDRKIFFGKYGFKILFFTEKELYRNKNWEKICLNKIKEFMEVNDAKSV